MTGRVGLDWRKRPFRFHPEGCLLCCTFRAQPRPGATPRHPGDACPNCGPIWRGKRPDLCIHCHRTAHFLNDDRRPVHKTCEENFQASAAAPVEPMSPREAA